MRKPTPFLLTFAVVLLSCGDGADRSDDASAAADAREMSAAHTPSGGTCDALAVSHWEAFGAHESLPVDFEHPAGWSHRRAGSDLPWHGFVEPGGGQRIQLEYILSPGTPPDIARQMRQDRMEVLRTVELSVDTVEVWGQSFPESATAKAILTLPSGDANYDLILTVRAPRACDIADVEAIRRHVVDTLAPNEDTDFDPEAFMATFQ